MSTNMTNDAVRHQAHTPPIIVSSGDFFELMVEQSQGSNLTLTGGNNVTWFGIQVLATST